MMIVQTFSKLCNVIEYTTDVAGKPLFKTQVFVLFPLTDKLLQCTTAQHACFTTIYTLLMSIL